MAGCVTNNHVSAASIGGAIVVNVISRNYSIGQQPVLLEIQPPALIPSQEAEIYVSCWRSDLALQTYGSVCNSLCSNVEGPNAVLKYFFRTLLPAGQFFNSLTAACRWRSWASFFFKPPLVVTATFSLELQRSHLQNSGPIEHSCWNCYAHHPLSLPVSLLERDPSNVRSYHQRH